MSSANSAPADIGAELATLVDRFFRSVSFEPGQPPGYGGIRELFIDDGTLIGTSTGIPEIWSVEAFIASRQRLVDSGELTSFEEVETAEATEVFGNFAHRFTAYSKRGTREGQSIAARGLISTQFVRTSGGWRMSSMAWDDERPGLVIPDRLGTPGSRPRSTLEVWPS